MPQYLGLPYKPIYEPDKNPHNKMSAYKENGVRVVGKWKCEYCGMIGTMGELNAIACGHEYPPCRACGCAPLCAADCPGIMSVLNNPDVHIAGDTREKQKGGRS